MAGIVIRSKAIEEAHAHPEMIRSGAYSPAVKAGPFLYVSGCIANDLSNGMSGQAREEFSFCLLYTSPSPRAS